MNTGALANEQVARQQAESNAATHTNSVADIQLVPKPCGSAGDGYCLIEEMGLENEKLSYNAVVVSHLLPYFHKIHFFP